MTEPSDARSSLFQALQQQRTKNSEEPPSGSLERHLEMLFSDAAIEYDIPPRHDLVQEVAEVDQPSRPRAVDWPLPTAEGISPVPGDVDIRTTHRFAAFFGAAAILVLIGALFLNSQVRPLRANHGADGPQINPSQKTQVEDDIRTQVPSPENPQAVWIAPKIPSREAAPGPASTGSGGTAPAPSSDPPGGQEPTATSRLPAETKRRGEAISTVRPMVVPATTTPTPTYRPAKGADAPTATSVPAYRLGIGTIPTPVPRIPLPEHAINVVLLGSDQRPYETGWRTDVIIIISVDPDAPSVSMVSIPRDTWLYIPNWTYQRINMADSHGAEVGYPGGGPGLVKATIEYNFGVHVDYFARVNFAGLINIVDALGGIEILLECPVEDGFPDDPITEDPSVVTQISYPEPGVYRIDGKHALWLSRSRKTTSEFDRSRRQHRVLFGIWTKAKQLGFIAKLPELWDSLVDTVETDLSLEDVLWLASIGVQLDPSRIQSEFLDGRHLSAWVTPGGGNVLLPHIEEILAFLEPHFNPYQYKAAQGVGLVEVWNGSGHADWGLLAADQLLRNGFEVVDIQSIEETPTSSIYDFTSKKKGSPEGFLERLFHAEAVHVFSEPTADRSRERLAQYRVVIGADYNPCDRPVAAQWIATPTPAVEGVED